MSLNQHFSTQPASSKELNDDASMMGRQQKIDDMRLRVERQLQAMLTGTSNDFTTLRKQVEELKTKPFTVNSRRASTGDDRSTHTSASSLPPEPQEIVWQRPSDNSSPNTRSKTVIQQKLIVTESFNSKADPQEITWNPNASNQNTSSQASTTVSQMLLGDDDDDDKSFEGVDDDYMDDNETSQDLTSLEGTTVAATIDNGNMLNQKNITKYVMNQHVTDPYGDQGEYTGPSRSPRLTWCGATRECDRSTTTARPIHSSCIQDCMMSKSSEIATVRAPRGVSIIAIALTGLPFSCSTV